MSLEAEEARFKNREKNGRDLQMRPVKYFYPKIQSCCSSLNATAFTRTTSTDAPYSCAVTLYDDRRAALWIKTRYEYPSLCNLPLTFSGVIHTT
jgi:hypothetical protein